MESGRRDEPVLKEVKVKIPVGHHVRLHSVKVLTGKAISDTVADALDRYFAAQPADAYETRL